MRSRFLSRVGADRRSAGRMLRAGAIALLVGCAACQQLDEPAPNLVTGVSVKPKVAYVVQGSTKNMVATVGVSEPRTRTDVVWSLHGDGCAGASCGTISFANDNDPDHATYEAPAVVPVPLVVEMTAASYVDPSKTAVARLTIGPTPISVTVDPSEPVHIHPDESATYVATVTGDALDAGVSWSYFHNPWGGGPRCDGPCGSFSSTATGSGVPMTYTAAPASTYPYLPQIITLVAASVTDPTKVVRLDIFIDAP